MAMVKLFVQLFINNTSMRGWNKLYKTREPVLKVLWSVYVLSMICLLIAVGYFLIEHYSSYFVTVQQSERVQDLTPFPSICVCSERPIGDEAMSWWTNKSIMSPLNLHASIRASMLKAYADSNDAKNLDRFFAAKDLFYADKISTYFQNLGVLDGRRIGIQEKDLVLFCLMKHSPNGNPSVAHDEICKLSVKWIRHPQYMNCYDLTIHLDDSPDISSVSLILRSGQAPIVDESGEQTHAFDLFSQSVGVRLTLHDPGSFPNIDEYGVSIGLRKNTRIRYNLVRHQRLNLGLGVINCLDNDKVDSKEPLADFTQKYSYTHHACMSKEIGQVIMDRCGCVSAYHLVSDWPHPGKPFCHYHQPGNSSQLEARLNCVRNVKVKEAIKQLRQEVCLHRCQYNRYQVQISSSDWVPTQWQLKHIMTISPVWDTITDKEAATGEKRRAMNKLVKFLKSNNPVDINANVSDFDLSRLTLVTITRSSYNTLFKTEKLQITLSTLLAQLGGMGSLTIGLTLTFFFEMMEFAYLATMAVNARWRGRHQRQGGQENGEQEVTMGLTRQNDNNSNNNSNNNNNSNADL